MNFKKYHIILFNNKTKKKILLSSNILKTITKEYKELTKKTNTIFPLKILNRKKCHFELALVVKKGGEEKGKLKKDALGRWVTSTINNENYQFIKIVDYSLEATLYDHKTRKRIKSLELIKSYIPSNVICQLFSLNNKIVIQNDDNFYIFSLKNVNECQRFMESIKTYFRINNMVNCLIIKDISTVQRKQLYKILENKGFKKSFLYKHYTK